MDLSVFILAILGSILVAGAATSTIIIPVLANDLTPEDLLSLQDPLQEKVIICHIPPGQPENRHEITVGASAVPTHLAHGDFVGPCVTEPPPPPPPTDTGRVTVTKLVNGGPLTSPEQFTICVDTRDPSTGAHTPATPPCAPGSASGFTYTVKPGEINIQEPGAEQAGYLVGFTCSSPPPHTVTAGQTVTCTVTNTFTG